jgi:hypothetical protein
MGKGARILMRWMSSTPRRTFVGLPILIIALELSIRGGQLAVLPLGSPLLIWGYAQYRLSGEYRTRHGGGGPGLGVPPTRLVTTGPYAWLRNPMYLGHLIFLAGLAVTFESWCGAALCLFHIWWFDRRVKRDEKHVEKIFGLEYRGYALRVRRWGVI